MTYDVEYPCQARLLNLPREEDDRGRLVFGQFPEHLPFQPTRFFIVQASNAGIRRGGHAHRKCHQLLVPIWGTVEVRWQDRLGEHIERLNRNSVGLYIPPLVWAEQTYSSKGAALLVLASDPYDSADYIDDEEEAKHERVLRLRKTDQRETHHSGP